MDDVLGPDAEPEEGLLAVPSFAGGGRVERTGIALVHEDEWIVPEPGSEAAIAGLPADAVAGAGADSVAAAAGQVVNYHFPIEVELVGRLSDDQRRDLAEFVYDELDAALRGQG